MTTFPITVTDLPEQSTRPKRKRRYPPPETKVAYTVVFPTIQLIELKIRPVEAFGPFEPSYQILGEEQVTLKAQPTQRIARRSLMIALRKLETWIDETDVRFETVS